MRGPYKLWISFSRCAPLDYRRRTRRTREAVDGGTHVNSVSFMVSTAYRADSLGLLCGCPSAACERAGTTGLRPNLLPLARGPRGNEYQATTWWKETERGTPLQSRRLCTLECRVEFPLLSIYIALSLWQQPPVVKPRPR